MIPRFISEPITPVMDSVDTRAMAVGGPGFPMRFIWRGREVAVDSILDEWKQTSPCTHGSGERYVSKHWFRVRANDGVEMKIYYERQQRSTRSRKARWWLYTVEQPGAASPGGA